MKVDWTVRTKRVQVTRAAIVLIDEAMHPVGHDEGRISAGSVGDGRFDVNGHRESVAQVGFLTVLGADELVESE